MVLGRSEAEPSPRAFFDRRARAAGVTAWTAGVLDRDVVLLLASPEAEAWTRLHYRQRYGLHDGVVRVGRGDGPPVPIDALAPASAMDARIARERAAHGLTSGLLVPLGDGGFVSLYGVPAEVLARSDGFAFHELVNLAHYLARRDRFADARRVHRSGERLSPQEAAVCRAHLAGYSLGGIAERLGITERTVNMHLDRAKRRLVQLAVLPDWAKRQAVPAAARAAGLFDPALDGGPRAQP